MVIDLDFDTFEAAARFREFLETKVWAVSENSPGPVGRPQTRIFEPAPI